MTQSSDLQPWIRNFAPLSACKCPVKVDPRGVFVKVDPPGVFVKVDSPGVFVKVDSPGVFVKVKLTNSEVFVFRQDEDKCNQSTLKSDI